MVTVNNLSNINNQISTISNNLITSPGFNCQCLVPNSHLRRAEAEGTQEGIEEALLYFYFLRYILFVCLASTSNIAHKKEIFVRLSRVSGCLVPC